MWAIRLRRAGDLPKSRSSPAPSATRLPTLPVTRPASTTATPDQPLTVGHRPTYLPALDGLRALAIGLVVVAHYGFAGVPAGFGVTLFFFISGLLITNLLLAEARRTGRIGLTAFYLRRLLRLYPALLLMISLTLLYVTVRDGRISPHSLGAALFYYQNYFSAYQPLPPDNASPWYFLILWSLAVEEHFYVVYPLLFSWLRHQLRWFMLLMGVLCVLALLRRIHLFYSLADTARAIELAGSLTEARLDSILYGCLVAVGLNSGWKDRFVEVIGGRWVFILASAVLVVSILYRDDFFRAAGRYVVQPVALACLIPALLFHPAYSKLRVWLSVPALVYLGRLSYSLYLFHWLGLCVAFDYRQLPYSDFKPGQPGFYAIVGLALPLSVGATLVSYYCVERPLLVLRKRLGSAAR